MSAGHRDAGRAPTRPPAAVGRPGLQGCRDAAGATHDRVPCGAAESCDPLRFLCQRSACSLVRRTLAVHLPGHTLDWPSTVNGRLGATCRAGSSVAFERGRRATRATLGVACRAPERDRQERRPPDSPRARGQSRAAACFWGVRWGCATCETVENGRGGALRAPLSSSRQWQGGGAAHRLERSLALGADSVCGPFVGGVAAPGATAPGP